MIRSAAKKPHSCGRDPTGGLFRRCSPSSEAGGTELALRRRLAGGRVSRAHRLLRLPPNRGWFAGEVGESGHANLALRGTLGPGPCATARTRHKSAGLLCRRPSSRTGIAPRPSLRKAMR